MGGPGSGSGWRRSSRATVEGYRRLDVRALDRAGLLRGPGTRSTTWQWKSSETGEPTASVRLEASSSAVVLSYRVDGEAKRYSVTLEWTPCNYGGLRPWFRCPAQGCGRRCAVLHGGAVFACRQCHGLAYASQHEDEMGRAQRRAAKVYARLGVDREVDWVPKPHRMRQRTFDRLMEKAEAADAAALGALVGHFRRFIGQ